MTRYFVSRALISTAFSFFLAFIGAPWWMAVLAGILVFAFFLWAPRSGRYAVHPELGATALRRDERAQTITDKAARNGFVAMTLMMAGLAVYFGSIAPAAVPVAALNIVLLLGALTYFVSDAWLRRA